MARGRCCGAVAEGEGNDVRHAGDFEFSPAVGEGSGSTWKWSGECYDTMTSVAESQGRRPRAHPLAMISGSTFPEIMHLCLSRTEA